MLSQRREERHLPCLGLGGAGRASLARPSTRGAHAGPLRGSAAHDIGPEDVLSELLYYLHHASLDANSTVLVGPPFAGRGAPLDPANPELFPYSSFSTIDYEQHPVFVGVDDTAPYGSFEFLRLSRNASDAHEQRGCE